jgi:hypothetical protein
MVNASSTPVLTPLPYRLPRDGYASKFALDFRQLAGAIGACGTVVNRGRLDFLTFLHVPSSVDHLPALAAMAKWKK